MLKLSIMMRVKDGDNKRFFGGEIEIPEDDQTVEFVEYQLKSLSESCVRTLRKAAYIKPVWVEFDEEECKCA